MVFINYYNHVVLFSHPLFKLTEVFMALPTSPPLLPSGNISGQNLKLGCNSVLPYYF